MYPNSKNIVIIFLSSKRCESSREGKSYALEHIPVVKRGAFSRCHFDIVFYRRKFEKVPMPWSRSALTSSPLLPEFQRPRYHRLYLVLSELALSLNSSRTFAHIRYSVFQRSRFLGNEYSSQKYRDLSCSHSSVNAQILGLLSTCCVSGGVFLRLSNHIRSERRQSFLTPLPDTYNSCHGAEVRMMSVLYKISSLEALNAPCSCLLIFRHCISSIGLP